MSLSHFGSALMRIWEVYLIDMNYILEKSQESRLSQATRSHLWLPGTNALSRTLASHPDSHCLGSGVQD